MNRRTAVRVIAGGSTLALGLRDLLRPQPSAAQAGTFTTNFPVPVDFVFSDCAGEPVHMTGVMHQLVHFTNNGSGGGLLVLTSNYQGVKGVGLVSGTQYVGTNADHLTIDTNSSDPFPFELTFHGHISFIGPGPGNNVEVDVTIHTTINANGQMTAEVVEVRARA